MVLKNQEKITLWIIHMDVFSMAEIRFKIGQVLGGICRKCIRTIMASVGGKVVWQNRFSLLWSWNPLWVLVQDPVAPLPSQFPANAPRRQQRVAQVLGALHSCCLKKIYRLLALVWPSRWKISVPLPLFQINKNIKKERTVIEKLIKKEFFNENTSAAEPTVVNFKVYRVIRKATNIIPNKYLLISYNVKGLLTTA